MSDIAYVSESYIGRQREPVRSARLPGEVKPVIFSVHGAVAQHYGIKSEEFGESHATRVVKNLKCMKKGWFPVS